MRTTLDIPDYLISEALKVTHIKKKTEVIIFALENLIKKEKIQKLKAFKGKVKLKIDLDTLRNRWIKYL